MIASGVALIEQYVRWKWRSEPILPAASASWRITMPGLNIKPSTVRKDSGRPNTS
jgi:hypothetical protein